MPSTVNETRDIHQGCERIFLQLAHLTDLGPQQDIADLFEEEGELDREGTIIRGRNAIRESYAKRPSNLLTRHLVSNFTITVLSTTEAQCQAYATVYRFRGPNQEKPTPPVDCHGPESLVEYEDQMVLTQQGWRIRKRKMRTVINIKLPT